MTDRRALWRAPQLALETWWDQFPGSDLTSHTSSLSEKGQIRRYLLLMYSRIDLRAHRIDS